MPRSLSPLCHPGHPQPPYAVFSLPPSPSGPSSTPVAATFSFVSDRIATHTCVGTGGFWNSGVTCYCIAPLEGVRAHPVLVALLRAGAACPDGSVWDEVRKVLNDHARGLERVSVNPVATASGFDPQSMDDAGSFMSFFLECLQTESCVLGGSRRSQLHGLIASSVMVRTTVRLPLPPGVCLTEPAESVQRLVQPLIMIPVQRNKSVGQQLGELVTTGRSEVVEWKRATTAQGVQRFDCDKTELIYRLPDVIFIYVVRYQPGSVYHNDTPMDAEEFIDLSGDRLRLFYVMNYTGDPDQMGRVKANAGHFLCNVRNDKGRGWTRLDDGDAEARPHRLVMADARTAIVLGYRREQPTVQVPQQVCAVCLCVCSYVSMCSCVCVGVLRAVLPCHDDCVAQ
jgi:hypothetical protein